MDQFSKKLLVSIVDSCLKTEIFAAGGPLFQSNHVRKAREVSDHVFWVSLRGYVIRKIECRR